MARILIADDSAAVRNWAARTLTEHGHAVSAVADGIEVERFLGRMPVDLVVLDIFMPEQDGLETLRSIRRHWSDLPVLMISGGGYCVTSDYLAAAARLGANRTLAKPFEVQEFVSIIEGLLPRRLVGFGSAPTSRAQIVDPQRLRA